MPQMSSYGNYAEFMTAVGRETLTIRLSVCQEM